MPCGPPPVADTIRVEVVHALPDRQRLIALDVAPGTTMLEAARQSGIAGQVEGLAYVSPRSGRAVTREGAGEYAERLLPLPRLLLDASAPESRAEMAQGLVTTGHFLREVLAPALGHKPLPEARARLVKRFD